MKKKLDNYLHTKKHAFNTKEVMEIFENHQQNKKDKRRSGKSQQNILRRNLRWTKQAYNDDTKYNDIRPKYIK